MRWDYDKVYKEIRKSKGLTQDDVCGEFLSRSAVARIESGKVVPRFETMIFLLDQIDMSVEEFRYICDYYQPNERQKILNALYNQDSHVETADLLQLKKECESYLRSHPDVPIEHVLDIINIFIHIRQNGLQDTKKIDALTHKIWSYLEKQDTWYESDFRLIASILFIFPLGEIKLFTQKILDSMKKYDSFHSSKSIRIGLLIHLSTIYLYNDLKEECENIIGYVLHLAQSSKRYDSLGFAHVRLGICRGDDDLIEKGLALLRLTDEDKLAETLEAEVKKYR